MCRQLLTKVQVQVLLIFLQWPLVKYLKYLKRNRKLTPKQCSISSVLGLVTCNFSHLSNLILIEHIYLKVTSKNGVVLKCPTLDTIDSVELLKQVFNLTLSSVFGVATIKSENRGVGFNFKLKKPIKLNPANFQTFEFIIRNDTYQGTLLLNLGSPPKLGDLVLLTVARTGYHFDDHQIYAWLNLYGRVEGELKYKDNPVLPGVSEDSLEVLIRLRKHIPAILPAYGKRMYIRYKGQPVQCSKCLGTGHIRRLCNSTANNWVGYIRLFVASGVVEDQMLGHWKDYLNDHISVLSDN